LPQTYDGREGIDDRREVIEGILELMRVGAVAITEPGIFGVHEFFILTQRSEGCTDLVAKFLRLFPRGEVTAFGKFVVMNEMGECFFGPGLWNLIDLVRERAHGHRNESQRNFLYLAGGET
jgi:hypothetical protein